MAHGFGLHRLGEDAEPDADRHRQEPCPGGPGELAERLLDALGQLLYALALGRDPPRRYRSMRRFLLASLALATLVKLSRELDEAGGLPLQVLRTKDMLS